LSKNTRGFHFYLFFISQNGNPEKKKSYPFKKEQDPRKDLDPTYHTPLAAAKFSAKKLWVKKLVQAVDY